MSANDGLQEWIKQYCFITGESGNSRPTMRGLAKEANIAGFKTKHRKEITLSTIQNTVGGMEFISCYWNKGRGTCEEQVLTPIQILTPTQVLQINQQNNQQNNVPLSSEAEIKEGIIRRCFMVGYMTSPEPTIDEICFFLNNIGYRTPKNTPLNKNYVYGRNGMFGVDITFEWYKGVEKAREDTNKTNDPIEAVNVICYECGLKNSDNPPKINEIVYLLNHRLYLDSSHKRFTRASVQVLITMNNIDLSKSYYKGQQVYKEQLRESNPPEVYKSDKMVNHPFRWMTLVKEWEAEELAENPPPIETWNICYVEKYNHLFKKFQAEKIAREETEKRIAQGLPPEKDFRRINLKNAKTDPINAPSIIDVIWVFTDDPDASCWMDVIHLITRKPPRDQVPHGSGQDSPRIVSLEEFRAAMLPQEVPLHLRTKNPKPAELPDYLKPGANWKLPVD